MSSSSGATRRITLSTDLFRKALDRYVDYNKLDPLSRKQLEGWTFVWKDAELCSDNGPTNESEFLPDPSHFLKGTLEIGGEHIVILLYAECLWKSFQLGGETSSDKTQYGQIHWSLRASARFWTKTELRGQRRNNLDESDIGESDNKDKKAQDKIRSKMVARLRDDDYISKLFVGKNNESSSSSSLSQSESIESNKSRLGPLMAQAKIQFGPTELEERVAVSENVSEAVKRAIWSTAESPLDVAGLFLSMPFLPTTEHRISGNSEESTGAQQIITTTLANRAKLRLLEDAMCDACDKEGDDELLDDLNLSEAGETKSSAKISSSHEVDWKPVCDSKESRKDIMSSRKRVKRIGSK